MFFSLEAFALTVGAVAVSGVIAALEGTATNRRVTMGFVNHAGMWGDLIILSTVNGLLYPHLLRNWICLFSSLLVALVVTVTAHAQWANSMRSDAITGHMFPAHETGKWYVDISAAGWAHVLVMALLLTAVLVYTVSPVPANVVVTISFLLTAHVFLATVQPGWYCTGKLWTWRNFGVPVLTATLIWCVAILKIQLAKGSL